eukprot:21471-Heterococcus_DN1.PRE.8
MYHGQQLTSAITAVCSQSAAVAPALQYSLTSRLKLSASAHAAETVLTVPQAVSFEVYMYYQKLPAVSAAMYMRRLSTLPSAAVVPMLLYSFNSRLSRCSAEKIVAVPQYSSTDSRATQQRSRLHTTAVYDEASIAVFGDCLKSTEQAVRKQPAKRSTRGTKAATVAWRITWRVCVRDCCATFSRHRYAHAIDCTCSIDHTG